MSKCTHPRVRCIHGDEIFLSMTFWDVLTVAPYRRVRCLDCNKALPRELPEICTSTNKPHTYTTETK